MESGGVLGSGAKVCFVWVGLRLGLAVLVFLYGFGLVWCGWNGYGGVFIVDGWG